MASHNSVVLIGKVVGSPKVKGNEARFALNVPELRKDEAAEGGWTHDKNVILVRAVGKAAEAAARLKDGDRVLVDGVTDTIDVPGVDKQGEPTTWKRVCTLAFAIRKGGSDNFNKVAIVGRLGKAPLAKYFESGNCIASFGVATDRWDKDAPNAEGGTGAEVTVWTDIKIVGRHAERAIEKLQKGSLVLIEGRLITEEWDDENGQKQKRTFVKSWDFKFMGAKRQAAEGGEAGENDADWGYDDGFEPAPGYDEAPPSRYERLGKEQALVRQAPPPAAGPDDLDAEIPF